MFAYLEESTMNLKNYIGKIVSIYECGESNFRLGKLIAADEEALILNLITTRGYEDGLYYALVDNVIRVDTDDRYIEKYTRLFSINSQEYVSDFQARDSLLSSVLDYISSKKLIASFEIDDDEWVTGRIMEITEDSVTISKIDDFGESDGLAEISIEYVTRIMCNSGGERILESLSG